jgi:hypothetical protein
MAVLAIGIGVALAVARLRVGAAAAAHAYVTRLDRPRLLPRGVVQVRLDRRRCTPQGDVRSPRSSEPPDRGTGGRAARHATLTRSESSVDGRAPRAAVRGTAPGGRQEQSGLGVASRPAFRGAACLGLRRPDVCRCTRAGPHAWPGVRTNRLRTGHIELTGMPTPGVSPV